MPAILFFVGLLIGLAIDEDVALPSAFCGLLLGLVTNLSRRVRSLSDRLAEVEGRVADVSVASAGAAPAADAVSGPDGAGVEVPPEAAGDDLAPVAPAAPRRVAPTLLREDDAATPPTDATEAMSDAAVRATGPEEAAPTADEWAAAGPKPEPGGGWREPEPEASDLFARGIESVKSFFTGGNAVVRIGVVVLFFGVAFLAKYAADAGVFPIEFRLSAIAALGVGLTLLGWRLRGGSPLYAVSLQGAGVGVFYLTVFAAYRLYGLLPGGAAFAVMLVVVALAGVLAVMQDARALATLGSAGGFLAPVLASTGGGSHVSLFTYYLVLNLGILGIAWHKAWRSLNVLGFAFTFIIGAAWGYRFYAPRHFDTTEPFLIAFGVLYTAVAMLFALRQPPNLRGYVDGTLVFGTPLVAFALQSRLVEGTEYGLAWSALGASAFYLALGWGVRRAPVAGLALLGEAFLALAIAFATVAVPLALDARWTASTWALEGAGIVWIGVRQHRLLARLFGLAVQVLAAGALVLDPVHGRGVDVFLNGQYIGVALVAGAGVFSGIYLHRHRDVLRSIETHLPGAAVLWGVAWWAAGGVFEVAVRGGSSWDWGVGLLYLAATGFACNVLARREGWALIGYPSLALLPVGLATLILMLVAESHPFAALAWLGWPALFAAHYQALYRSEDGVIPGYRLFLHAGAVWLITAVVAWELGWQLSHWLGGWRAMERSAWGLAGALSLFVIRKGALGERWPFDPHRPVYLLPGAGPIVVAAWLWLLAMNLLPPGRGWPIDYVPLLNPIDIACGLMLLAIARWRQALAAYPDESSSFDPASVTAPLAATAFIWANGIVLRSIHFWFDVSYAFSPMFRSNLVQTSLAVFWASCALTGMVAAARLGRRRAWMVSAGLMAVVVLKLFLVDLANTGTLARIVSFLSVGGLMLVVGYFAPAPPRPAPQAPAQ